VGQVVVQQLHVKFLVPGEGNTSLVPNHQHRQVGM